MERYTFLKVWLMGMSAPSLVVAVESYEQTEEGLVMVLDSYADEKISITLEEYAFFEEVEVNFDSAEKLYSKLGEFGESTKQSDVSDESKLTKEEFWNTDLKDLEPEFDLENVSLNCTDLSVVKATLKKKPWWRLW